MPDISMCNGDGCPMKQECYRFTAEPSPYLQTYFVEPPLEQGECKYFWRVEKKTLDKKS